MSYDLINNGISNLMNKIGFQESIYASIDNVPSSEYGNTFLIARLSGQNESGISETISSLIYDEQIWEVQIAYQKSSENQSINFDIINRNVDLMIKTLDAPANWESYARVQKYLNWKIEEKKSYYLLTMQLKVEDTIVY